MTAIEDESGYGRYELLAKIGEGRRGPVFVARLRGEAIAEPRFVVELNAFATGEDEAMRAFHHDVSRAAEIRHKNVLGIVELGASGTGYYVAMDYVEGATLFQVQDRHRAMRPPRLVLAIMIDALHGLQEAHQLRRDGVVEPLLHGSVSPDQLFLGLDGSCRLTGFGNARPRVQTKPSHRNRSVIGFMAPEQLTGGTVDHRSDLFSMGVVLWNALTGKKLFHDRIEHQTMANVLERRVPRPSSIGLSPPPAFDAVVLKALERDPARRFQDAGELASALRDLARGAACLATASEVSEWVSVTFGSELAARRLALRELGHRPRRPSEVSVLTRIAGPGTAEPTGRDELSLDELARANDPPPRASSPSEPPTITHSDLVPVMLVREPSRRRQLAVVGVAAFAVVALVIGWRWSAAAAAEPGSTPAAATAAALDNQVALEVTVLDVHSVAAPALPAIERPVHPPTPAAIVAPPAIPAPAAASAPNRVPVRQPARPKRPASPARPASSDDRTEAVAPRPEPPAPEAPRPALEANPYVYK